MKSIKICIGSACHLKGSYEVIEAFKKLIKENNLEQEIELCASFCIGNCKEAVSVMRWDGVVFSVDKENAKDIFEREFKI
ncbi:MULTISPECIES: (2Fe-2S) ferredoxin domain-containing protein [Romboutsia]|uniref:Thioredoxin-like fold n=1 Tax=Romboutsia hominis TaxID=1507512 RepID=A0A2P2BQN3_9FIRM|nr:MULTISPECIES: (2Fe-2S) ferredoxin domain-containing protein [Romboutsia]MDB8794545.1 (2Fe-2S) ferredoxin domain-containing protein [Romboutsia sp. 1001216sp1]MDB8796115.1 (2Fe-2S) ferredoxin domain-containing protein [Romboutsia sp. 1001216sp1]MDB8798108.1 (2Fe-2S) ferredoxin domain-containing protein [Romboutsia sp. 1001216sp1]MDB8803516.1 (2Fe-2S) ferredoxin domain-containing protein [Romboutsia sp. 1001216sp1]MDB8808456.1 (2Fe-2S) ferredoxin domain-containing protein [Romboutsia sp. 1001